MEFDDIAPLRSQMVTHFECWQHHNSIRINSPIAVGWKDEDHLLICYSDGDIIFDVNQQLSPYDPNSQREIVKGKLDRRKGRYICQNIPEPIEIFGMDKLGTPKLTSEDQQYRLRILPQKPFNNFIVIANLDNQEESILTFDLLDYEGYRFVGFSPKDTKFLIAGDMGIEIFVRHCT